MIRLPSPVCHARTVRLIMWTSRLEERRNMKATVRSGILLVLMLVLAVPAGLVGAAPLAVDGPNLLNNPGFESPYGKQCCQTDLSKYYPNTPIDEVQVAQGWSGWWLQPDSDPQHPAN